MNLKERQAYQTDILTGLVGHEHHCYICGDTENLFCVKRKDKTGEGEGILCQFCLTVQEVGGGIKFVSIKPYKK
jgi:hypothetical protein